MVRGITASGIAASSTQIRCGHRQRRRDFERTSAPEGVGRPMSDHGGSPVGVADMPEAEADADWTEGCLLRLILVGLQHFFCVCPDALRERLGPKNPNARSPRPHERGYIVET